jgi:hypothetical protein
MESLKDIAKRVKPVKKYLTAFIDRYERLFAPIRNEYITILEIGVGGYKNPLKGGESLKMRSSYFPNAIIIGLDQQCKDLQLPNNVIVRQGSQTDAVLLKNLVGLVGGFDIVIDDASHVTENTIITFEALQQTTHRFYIIEDLHMAKAAGTKEYFQRVPGADFQTKNLCVITK